MKPEFKKNTKEAEETTKDTDKKKSDLVDDEFFTEASLVTVKKDVAAKQEKRIYADIEEMIRQCRWDDALSLYYPVEEKLPELLDQGMASRVREKMAFVLGQVKRFDEAISELKICVEADPENFYTRSSLAYTAYNSLYAAKNREIMMPGHLKAERIKLAHENFEKACEIRPEDVTCAYRNGMLYKQIENKIDRAGPFFEKAVANWEQLSAEDKEKRHQQRKNYIKALYQLAACRLEAGDLHRAMALIKQCLSEDEKSGHLSLVFKYFALGKILFNAGSFPEARDALLFAVKSGQADRQPIDFVYELLARNYLAMAYPERAREMIKLIPENKRRPYVRWTEADVHCALEQYDQARQVLKKSLDRDSRSKHKTLIKLARLEYGMADFEAVAAYAEQADRFFREKWGNPCLDGLFWGAAAALRNGRKDRAVGLTEELQAHAPNYPKLKRLQRAISDTWGENE
ncbi:MAG: tetratricopeptide repeat protein [Desulfobacterales bacterium]